MSRQATWGRWRRQSVAEGSEAVRERWAQAPRPSQQEGAGEARLLQWAQLRRRPCAREFAPDCPRAGSARRDQETVRRTLLTPWRRIPRGYLPVRMEERLDLYDSPTMRAIRCSAGTNDPNRGGQKRGRRSPRDRDIPPSTYAYVQHGSCTVWLCVEPLGPWRTANATARLTELSWSGGRASAQCPAAKARV